MRNLKKYVTLTKCKCFKEYPSLKYFVLTKLKT